MSGQRLRIGEAAARAAVSVRTLRYYEELGLLTPSAHSPGGARRYAEEDLARLARIRELKDLLGFNLDEVRAVLTAEDRLGSLRAAYHAEADHAAQQAIVAEAVEINTRLQAAVQPSSRGWPPSRPSWRPRRPATPHPWPASNPRATPRHPTPCRPAASQEAWPR
jgi:DNA-binding transcriptional MerR regulator